jgi:hypothetical protein
MFRNKPQMPQIDADNADQHLRSSATSAVHTLRTGMSIIDSVINDTGGCQNLVTVSLVIRLYFKPCCRVLKTSGNQGINESRRTRPMAMEDQTRRLRNPSLYPTEIALTCGIVADAPLHG